MSLGARRQRGADAGGAIGQGYGLPAGMRSILTVRGWRSAGGLCARQPSGCYGCPREAFPFLVAVPASVPSVQLVVELVVADAARPGQRPHTGQDRGQQPHRAVGIHGRSVHLQAPA